MDDTGPHPSLETLLAHGAWARKVAERLLTDPHAAEDCVQETWIASLSLPLREGGAPRPWLRRVLSNFAFQRLRGEERRARRERDHAGSEEDRSTYDVVARMELQQELARMVLGLAEPYRTTLVQHFYEDLSSAEIARRDGLSDATVRSRLRRGLQLLRQRWSARCGESEDWRLSLCWMLGRDPARLAPLTPALVTLVPRTLLVLALLGLGWVAWPLLRGTRVEPLPRGLADAGEPSSHLDGESLAPSASEAPATSRRASTSAATERSASATPSGWWLELALRDEAGWIVGADVRVGVTAALERDVLHFRASEAGPLRLDVSTLFLAADGMPLQLFVAAEDEAHVPGKLALALDRAARQGGFRAEGGVLLPAALELERARCVLAGSAPLARAGPRLAALFPDTAGDTPWSSTSRARSDWVDRVRLDESGAFRLRAPRPGAYWLVVAPERDQPSAPALGRRIELGPGASRLELACDPGSLLEGRLRLAGGRAGAHCRVAVTLADQSIEAAANNALGAAEWRGHELVLRPRSTTTDAEGGFRFEGLVAGEWELAFEGFESPAATAWIGPPAECLRRIRLPAGWQELELASHALLVLELVRDGAPVRGARLLESGALSDESGHIGVYRPPAQPLELHLRAPPSAPTLVAVPAELSIEPAVLTQVLPGLGARATLLLAAEGDPERQLEAGILELHPLGSDLLTPGAARELVWRGRVRRMQEGLRYEGLPAGRWLARWLPAGPGPEAGEERSFCEEVFVLDLAPGEQHERRLALERGGWLRILPGGLGDYEGEATCSLRRASGAPAPTVLVARSGVGTRPATLVLASMELESASALPPGDYELALEPRSGPRQVRSFRIEPGRTTLLAPGADPR